MGKVSAWIFKILMMKSAKGWFLAIPIHRNSLNQSTGILSIFTLSGYFLFFLISNDRNVKLHCHHVTCGREEQTPPSGVCGACRVFPSELFLKYREMPGLHLYTGKYFWPECLLLREVRYRPGSPCPLVVGESWGQERGRGWAGTRTGLDTSEVFRRAE